MNSRQLELATRRGELRARCAMQREALAAHVWPVEKALAGADQALLGIDWLKRHPAAVLAGVAVVLMVSPGRAWRWARRSFLLWRGWKSIRSKLLTLR